MEEDDLNPNYSGRGVEFVDRRDWRREKKTPLMDLKFREELDWLGSIHELGFRSNSFPLQLGWIWMCGCTHAGVYYNHEFCVPLGMNVIFVHYPVCLYVCCLRLCVYRVLGWLSTAALAAPCSRRIREVALLKWSWSICERECVCVILWLYRQWITWELGVSQVWKGIGSD